MRVAPVDERTWLEIASASPDATFFHTPYWARAGTVARPEWQEASLVATLSDGARAVYPLLEDGAGGAAVSTFAGCYGGPIAERPLSDEEVAQLHRAAAGGRSLRALTRHQVVPGGFTPGEDFTHVVDLRGGFDAVLRGFKKSQREALRRGEREGLRVKRNGAGAGEYWPIYEANLERWGDRASSRYPRALFDLLAEQAQSPGTGVALWTAHAGGDLLAGVWAFSWGRSVVVWHAASQGRETPGFSPHVSIYAAIMRDAAERGLECFDFNPSGGHTGTASFKSRLGARQVPVLRLTHAGARGVRARLAGAARRLVSGRARRTLGT